MKSTRTVPGRPVNAGAETVQKIVELIADTLDQSDTFDRQAASDELDSAATAIGLLALGGHLRDGRLVLVSEGLRLAIRVPVGEAALSSEEDLRRPRLARGAASWTLYLPVPDQLAAAIRAAERACAHVSTEEPPDEAPLTAKTGAANTIDLSRLRAVRSSR